MEKINERSGSGYLFFITFLSLLAIFPILTDLVINAFFGEIIFFTPDPSNTIRLLLILSSAVLLSIMLVWAALRKNNPAKLEYFAIVVLRYTLVFAMVGFYGYAKLLNKQFHINYSALETPLKDVGAFHLTWYFFGRSNAETFIFALFEIIPGTLLLFRRTTFLGAVLLLPFMLNVFFINIFNEISWLTLRYSFMFLFFDVGILLFYRREIAEMLTVAKRKLIIQSQRSGSKNIFKGLKFLFIALLLFRFGVGIYNENNKLKSKCYGIYELGELSYDNKLCVLDSLDDYWKKLYFEKRNGWNFHLKNKKDDQVIMRYTFYENKDSIKILAYTGFEENGDPIDSIVFKGNYFLNNNDSVLMLSGKQNDKLMTAVYRKLPIDGFDWWW